MLFLNYFRRFFNVLFFYLMLFFYKVILMIDHMINYALKYAYYKSCLVKCTGFQKYSIIQFKVVFYLNDYLQAPSSSL